MGDTLVRKSNLDKLRQVQDSKNNEGGFKFWKPIKYGKYTVRFLPPTEPDGLFYKELKQHKVGENFVFCPKVNQEPCPICDLYKKLYDMGTDDAINLAKEIKGRKQYLYNIVIRDEDGKAPADPKKVFIYMSGKKLFDTLVDYFFDDDYGDLTDVEKGFDFVIKKEEGDLGFPNYDNSKPRRNPTPLADDSTIINEILSNARDLNKEVEILSFDELKKMLEKFLEAEKSGKNKAANAVQSVKTPAVAASTEAEDEAPAPKKKAPEPEDLDDFEKSLLSQIED